MLKIAISPSSLSFFPSSLAILRIRTPYASVLGLTQDVFIMMHPP